MSFIGGHVDVVLSVVDEDGIDDVGDWWLVLYFVDLLSEVGGECGDL